MQHTVTGKISILPVLMIALLLLSAAPVVTTGGGKQAEDSMRYLDNGKVKIGVDLHLGGAITYLEDKRYPGNMINNHDWGRQIQMSFYSGPVPFTPGGKQPHPTWKNLGWNPIQSGDWAGNTSKIISYHNSGTEIYVKCIPMQWPLDNVPGDCSFETWIRLEGNTVKVKARINNNRTDKTFYGNKTQEQPAIYTNISFNQLYTYQGPRPYTNDTVSRIHNSNLPDTKEIKWASWEATEHWAANLNKEKRGLGVWMPGSQLFCGGSYGYPYDTAGTKATATAYISPLSSEILDHNIRYDYSYTLIVGSLDEIRNYVYTNRDQKSKPGYQFTNDRQHFYYENVTDQGWPVKGFLDLALQKGSAIISPPTVWEAEKISSVYIEAASTIEGKGRIGFQLFGEKNFTEPHSKLFGVTGDNKFHTYRIQLTDIPGYKGVIRNIKIEPITGVVKPGEHFKIKSIRLR